MNILANDGLSQSGITALKEAGFGVLTTNVAQEQLAKYINTHKIAALLVRSNTQVQKDIIDECPTLKLIGRAGVGLDNIDVLYAKEKGITVINTPTASSNAVAELVFAHLLGGARYLHDANRNMPLDGDSKFKALKKGYANGFELRGKTLGVIGFGNIGVATAKIAIAMGMKVVYHDTEIKTTVLELPFFDGQSVSFNLNSLSKEEVLENADFISLHIPNQKKHVIGKPEFELMKNGVGIVNTARGGVLDEVALIAALKSGKVAFAGLDVFESEPTPEIPILMHPDISLSPHIGGSTVETQEKIGIELATQIISILN